jgi:hypothetical protein
VKTSVQITRTLAALTLAVAMLGGCKKQPDAGEKKADRKPMVLPEERQRTEQACLDYVTKLCICSKMKPENTDLAKRCELEKALPDALHLAIGIDADPAADATTVASAQSQIKKIFKTCIEGVNEMVRSAEFSNCL